VVTRDAEHIDPSVERLGDHTRRYTFCAGSTELRWGDVIEALEEQPGFRSVLTRTLAESPPRTFFWETPAVTPDTLARPFEYVVVDTPALTGIAAEPGAFLERRARRLWLDDLAYAERRYALLQRGQGPGSRFRDARAPSGRASRPPTP
jgi:hypothetical protein